MTMTSSGISINQSEKSASGPSGFNWLAAVFKYEKRHAEATLQSQLVDSSNLQDAAEIQALIGSAAQTYSTPAGCKGFMPNKYYTMSAIISEMGSLAESTSSVDKQELNTAQSFLGLAQQQQSSNTQTAGEYVSGETNQATNADPTNTQQADQILSGLISSLNALANLQIH